MQNEKIERRFMEEAIRSARKAISDGQTPFGACIVKDGKIIASTGNSVWGDTDITAHAEINAIRSACKALNTVNLSGCTIYSTCEPCPMCFMAIHWAQINRVVFGASIADAKKAGFREILISTEHIKELGDVKVELIGGFLSDECRKLFEEWSLKPNKKAY